MSQRFEMNLNDQFWVKLSPRGKGIWAEWHRNLGIPTPTRSFDREGWIRLPLWEIAQIFGSHLFMGSVDLPFETMDLFSDKPN